MFIVFVRLPENEVFSDDLIDMLKRVWGILQTNNIGIWATVMFWKSFGDFCGFSFTASGRWFKLYLLVPKKIQGIPGMVEPIVEFVTGAYKIY